MTTFTVNQNCMNCFLEFDPVSQIFTEMTLDKENRDCEDNQTKIVDAIFDIYGLSVRELAVAHLDQKTHIQNSTGGKFNDSLEKVTKSISKNGVALCYTCLAVFKKVYVFLKEFENLSSEESLLRKAISKCFSSKIKIEEDAENSENEISQHICEEVPKHLKNINSKRFLTVSLKRLSSSTVKSVAVINSTDEMQNSFNFDEHPDGDTNFEDMKFNVDPLDVLQSSEQLVEDNPSTLKMDNVLPTRRVRPRKLNPQEYETYTEIQTKNSRDSSSDENISHKCPYCSREFERASVLKRHIERHLKRKKDEKAARFLVKQEISTEQKLKCSCGDIFKSLYTLKKHEVHDSEEPVKCDKCELTFKKQYQLYVHESIEHGERPNLLPECSECGKRFSLRQSLNQHKQEHHSSVKSYICHVCGNAFGSRRGLQKHKTIHTDEQSEQVFKCEHCDLVLKHRDSLRKHTRRMHSENPTKFICEMCGKETKSMTNMRIHMKVHDPNRNVKRNPKATNLQSTGTELITTDIVL